MVNLPPEILSKVFSSLGRKDKLECAVVCQAWCATSLHYLNSKLRLRTAYDVTKLFMKLCQLEGSIDGSSIRHLSFSGTWGANLVQVNKTIFTYILSACTNLQVLEFEEDRSTEVYCGYMIHYRSVLQLGSLQRIISPSASRYNANYLLANWEFRQSINHLEFELVRGSFEDIPQVDDIYTYVRQFPALRILALEFHTMICLDKLLSACPQLESLQLYYGCMVNHLHIYADEDEEESDEDSSTTHTHFPLKHLDIDAKYVSQDMFEYLHDHTSLLTQLTINNNAASSELFTTAFTTPLVVNTALPTRSLKLKKHRVMSSQLITGLNDNFQTLKRIEFDKCQFEDILTQDSNLTLNFDALRLDYLSIDFTSVISRNTLINSMCLVIKRRGKETLFYQRASKWTTHHLFTRNQTPRYANENLHMKRLMSSAIAVITVEASTLGYIRMHCNGYRDFNQIIALD